MARSHGEGSRSPAAGLLALARLKAGLSQRQLAERAGVPPTMISAYERDKRQPTLDTLLRMIRAAGYDLRMHLEAYDDHDAVLAMQEAALTPRQRAKRRRDHKAWAAARPVSR